MVARSQVAATSESSDDAPHGNQVLHPSFVPRFDGRGWLWRWQRRGKVCSRTHGWVSMPHRPERFAALHSGRNLRGLRLCDPNGG